MKKYLPTIILFTIIIGVIALAVWFSSKNSSADNLLAGISNIFLSEKESSNNNSTAKIINLHSHPQQGENWIVSFETQGKADLKIIPVDQATIEDDEFVALYCGEEERKPEILEGDIIYYANWQCSQKAHVIHYTKKSGRHTLRFVFGNSEFFAYNSAAWYHPKWGYRKKITIQNANVDGDLTDFPLYVDITSDEDIGGNAQADGDDIRFTLDDGITVIPHEEENFTVSAGSATGHFWVKVPTVTAASSTDIYVYYGNSDAADSQDADNTWEADFQAVYHMAEDAWDGTPDEVNDSSGTGNYGVRGGDATTTASGKIYRGGDWPGTDDYVDITDTTASTSFSVSFWGNLSDPPGDYSYIMDAGTGRWVISMSNSNFQYYDGSDWQDYGAGIAYSGYLNAWHHYVWVFDNGENDSRLYIDGSLVGTVSNVTWNNIGGTVRVGLNNSTTLGDLDGILDELRVIDDIRTLNEIKFEYHNTYETDNELTWDDQESYSAPSFIRFDGQIRIKGGIIIK